MARKLILVALVVVAAAAVAAAQEPRSPEGSWNLFGGGSVGRPLPGMHLKQTDKTVARLAGMFQAKGRMPAGGYDADALKGAMQGVFDSWGLTGPGQPMADFEVKLGKVDVWPEGDEGSDELGMMVGFAIWRKDGADFDGDAIAPGKNAANLAASTNADLSNAGFGALNIRDVRVRRKWNEDDKAYEADFHMLEFLMANAPIMAPGARVRANGGIEASRGVEAGTLEHYFPKIMSGCMSEFAMFSGMDFGVSPSWFKFIRVAEMPLGQNGEDGVRTLFALNLDLPPFQGSAQIAQFLAYTLPECFDKQLSDAIPFIFGEQVDGRMFEPEVEAFLQPERFMRRDNHYFAASWPTTREAAEELFFEKDEKMYQAMAQASNAAIDWKIMNDGGDPMGPRMNASNFEIVATGFADLGPGVGGQAHVVARVFGTQGVDFPNPTPTMFRNVMNPVLAHFFGPMAKLVPFFGGGGDPSFKAARIVFRVGGLAKPLQEGWSAADSVIKGLVSMYTHAIAGNVAGANLYGMVEGARLQIWPGWSTGYYVPTTAGAPPTYSFNAVLYGPAAVVDAALAQLDSNTDNLEAWIAASFPAPARRLATGGIEVSFRAEQWAPGVGAPPGVRPDAIVSTFGVGGVQVPNADVDAFKFAVESSIRETLIQIGSSSTVQIPLVPAGGGGVHLIGCFFEGPTEATGSQQPGFLKCQVETDVPQATRDLPGFMASLPSIVTGATAGATTAFQRIWGSDQVAFFPCGDCGTAVARLDDSQMMATIRLTYNNLRIEMFAPFEANNGALKVLYTAAVVDALRKQTGFEGIVAGDLYIDYNNNQGGRRLGDHEFGRRLEHDRSTFAIHVAVDGAPRKTWIESDEAQRQLQADIDNYMKANAGMMTFPDAPPAPPPPPCIAHVFKYDRGDGTPAQVATNNCYAAFPASSCNGAPEIDDGRGNKYKLMGSWASYNHLQTC